jgi:hypothetical protein
VSDNAQVEDLLLEGIKAARAGDKETARELLQEVIEKDQYNEKAWFWLASVVETDEERRTCLGNVVLINPNNQRAQELLERLERGESGDVGQSIGGNRSSMVLIAVGLALLLGIVLVVILSALGGGEEEQAAAETATSTQTASPTVNLTLVTATNTLLPTDTNTPSFSTLPPTLTRTPTPTEPPLGGGTLEITRVEPGTFSGRVVIGSGRNFASREHIPLYIMALSAPAADQFVPLRSNDILGNLVSLNGTENRFVLERYNTGQQSVALQFGQLTGGDLQTLAQFWNRNPVIPEQLMPVWSPIDNVVMFAGQAQFTRNLNLYVLDLDAEPTTALSAFVSENINETWPEWSPDARRVAHVAEGSQGGLRQVDIRILNIADGALSALTTDGGTIIESMLDWGGPGDNFIIYSGNNGNGSDIWIAPVDAATPLDQNLPRELLQTVEDGEGDTPPDAQPPEDDVPPPDDTDPGEEDGSEGSDTGEGSFGGDPDEATPPPAATTPPTATPTVTSVPIAEDIVLSDITEPQPLIDLGPNDIMPRWSPDGRYILFSSDLIDDLFDIFLYDVETGEIMLLYGNEDTRDVVYDWFDG